MMILPIVSEAQALKKAVGIYKTIEYGAFAVHRLLVIVVDTELREEYLIFIACDCCLELFLRLCRAHTSLLDQGPESRVVEVIDMAIDLPPAQVVSDSLQPGILHQPSVERW